MQGYSVSTVASEASIKLIRAWNPQLAKTLEFFDAKYDRNCAILEQAVKVFNAELTADGDFQRYYRQRIGPPDGS